MIIPCPTNRFFIPYGVHNIDTWSGLFQTIAVSLENILITQSMEVGKAAAKFYFFAVYCDGAVSSFAFGVGIGFGNIVTVNTQVPTHTGMLELEEAGGTVGFAEVYYVFFC